MNEKRAREILKDWITPEDELFNLSALVSFHVDSVNPGILIDGLFTEEQMEAILWWMKDKRMK
ncbi:MAG: hypothetical protein KKD77_22485, partial [Gammaproteobacteria bacterium]|nr:hypothetical protein [Gammaproteobacteria bacterium]